MQAVTESTKNEGKQGISNMAAAQKQTRRVFYEDDFRIRWYETVSPESAAEYIRNQQPNRKLKLATVCQYAEDMKRGKWQTNHQNAIALDEDGLGVDIQHRMYGVIQSGVSIEMEFYQYKKKEDVRQAQLNMDGGVPRTNADRGVILYGMTNANRKISVTSLLKLLATSYATANRKISMERRMEIYYYFQDGMDLLSSHTFPAYISTPLALIYKRDPEFVIDIVDKLHTGANLSAKSPILAIRNFMNSIFGKSGGGGDNYKKAYKVFNALKAEHQEKDLTKLYDSPNGIEYFFKRQPEDVKFLAEA